MLAVNNEGVVYHRFLSDGSVACIGLMAKKKEPLNAVERVKARAGRASMQTAL